MVDSIKHTTNNQIITIQLFGTKNTMSMSLKNIYCISTLSDENNHSLLEYDDEKHTLDKFVKKIKKDITQTHIDKYNNPYILHLDECDMIFS